MKDWKIILASNSPRRKELLKMLDVDFEVRVLSDIDESYPPHLPSAEVAKYIACCKAKAYEDSIASGELVVTADTIVICDDEIMGKPHDEEDARRMLRKLSGRTHQVITGVCLLALKDHNLITKSFSVRTDVTFDILSDEDIDYYVTNYHPLDKAGAYGIQEWIGCVGVSRLEGSYFNVVGFPVQRIYREMKNFCK
ncbi:MAG: septum formation protein Maf [Prevotella sp.]|nr:septum formation protein Maf [Candidatus Equicola stercoris]